MIVIPWASTLQVQQHKLSNATNNAPFTVSGISHLASRNGEKQVKAAPRSVYVSSWYVDLQQPRMDSRACACISCGRSGYSLASSGLLKYPCVALRKVRQHLRSYTLSLQSNEEHYAQLIYDIASFMQKFFLGGENSVHACKRCMRAVGAPAWLNIFTDKNHQTLSLIMLCYAIVPYCALL